DFGYSVEISGTLTGDSLAYKTAPTVYFASKIVMSVRPRFVLGLDQFKRQALGRAASLHEFRQRRDHRHKTGAAQTVLQIFRRVIHKDIAIKIDGVAAEFQGVGFLNRDALTFRHQQFN